MLAIAVPWATNRSIFWLVLPGDSPPGRHPGGLEQIFGQFPLERGLRSRADDGPHDLAASEDLDGRDGRDPVFHGGARVLVHVHGDDVEGAGMFGCNEFEDW
jgi:hypothetical protein